MQPVWTEIFCQCLYRCLLVLLHPAFWQSGCMLNWSCAHTAIWKPWWFLVYSLCLNGEKEPRYDFTATYAMVPLPGTFKAQCSYDTRFRELWQEVSLGQTGNCMYLQQVIILVLLSWKECFHTSKSQHRVISRSTVTLIKVAPMSA